MFRFDSSDSSEGLDRGVTTIVKFASDAGDAELFVVDELLLGRSGRLMIGGDERGYVADGGKATLAEPLTRAFGAGTLVILLEVLR